MGSETKAQRTSKESTNETQDNTLDIYIGVFFDGTNNNKVQSMIGQYFRRKEIFEKYKLKGYRIKFDVQKDITKEVEITDFDSFIKSGITKDACKNILGFTDSDCDKIFGTSTTITNDFEKKIMEVDNSDDSYRWSSAAIGYSEGWNELLDNPANESDVIIASICKKIPNPIFKAIGNFEDYKNKFSNALYFSNKILKHKFIGNQIRTKLDYIAGLRSENNKIITDNLINGAGANSATYTNPAILENIYNVNNNNNTKRYSIYVEGSGADNIIVRGGKYGGLLPLTLNTDLIGLASGIGKTGVCSKCRKAVAKINEIVNKYKDFEINLHFDVFGFSRGATTSRIFTYLVNPLNKYNINSNDYKLYTGSVKPFLKNEKIKKEVRLLGLYDTVSSIGVINNVVNKIAGILIPILFERESLVDYLSKHYCHEYNVNDYGLWATTNAKNVIHFCALDEYRKNFALVDIENSIGKNGIEIFMPGCHTDIGGGAGLGLDDLKIINKEYLKINSITNLYDAICKIVEDAVIGSFELLKGFIIHFCGYSVYDASIISTAIGNLIKKVGNKLSELGYNLAVIIYEIINGSQIDNIINNLKNENLVEIAYILERGINEIEKVITNTANRTISIGESVSSIGNNILDSGEQIKNNGRKNIQIGKDQIKKGSESIIKNSNDFIKTIMNHIKWENVYFNADYPLKNYLTEGPSRNDIEIDSLEKLGWIPKKVYYISDEEKSFFTGRANDNIIKKSKTIVIDGTRVLRWYQRKNIGLYKYVKPGYSNVTLALMRDWALIKSDNNDLFDNIPIDFPIPSDLQSFYVNIKDKYLNDNKRYYCVPSLEQYQKLRCKYLHFSINERFLDLADNIFVNGPEIDKSGVITRRIYVGIQTQGASNIKYIYDYKNNNTIDMNVNMDENEFFYLYSSKHKNKEDYNKHFTIINSIQN